MVYYPAFDVLPASKASDSMPPLQSRAAYGCVVLPRVPRKTFSRAGVFQNPFAPPALPEAHLVTPTWADLTCANTDSISSRLINIRERKVGANNALETQTQCTCAIQRNSERPGRFEEVRTKETRAHTFVRCRGPARCFRPRFGFSAALGCLLTEPAFLSTKQTPVRFQLANSRVTHMVLKVRCACHIHTPAKVEVRSTMFNLLGCFV